MRRQRSASESLLSITLALEAFLVFFAALTAFALKAIDPVVALVGGGAFIVLLALCARLVRYASGRWFGWVLQVALVAIGILLPLMYVIGAVFLLLWAYCFFKGRQLDRLKAAHLESSAADLGKLDHRTTTKENPA